MKNFKILLLNKIFINMIKIFNGISISYGVFKAENVSITIFSMFCIYSIFL